MGLEGFGVYGGHRMCEWVDMGMKGLWVGEGVLELIWKV